MSDPRLTPHVESSAGTRGEVQTIARGRVSLRHAPSADAVQDNELLFGDVFTVFEREHGWAYGQVEADGYVGYIHTFGCDAVIAPTHRVIALATPLLATPDIKAPTRDLLPLNAKVKVLDRAKGFVRIAPDGFVFAEHLAPLDHVVSDWVATAERFVGTPYVWGGKTLAGLDCSGLVQTALASAGLASPRDADQQENTLGADVPFLTRKRGDLVFWAGHVGIMLDDTRVIHANAFHMQVEIEPLEDAVARITPVAGPVTAVKRL
jgi:NlpC/P60 family protein/dipeptidyl peptidase-like protein